MSIKRNIAATYASQIYVTLIGIVMVPLYVRYMGAEAYGLVGFFAMLQAWFQLLDMGLTPTMARETARFKGGATDALSLRRLLRSLEVIFVAVAVLGGGTMVLGAATIAETWLKVEQLPIAEVEHALRLMALIVALRWVAGLYRGAISGLEQLVWLSYFNMAIATFRFVLVLPFLIYVGSRPSDFFAYQLVLAVAELAVLVFQTYRLFPRAELAGRTPMEWAPLRAVLKFSLSIAFTSSVWVLVTQVDKLLLSKLLLLSDYAHFSLAVLVASGVMVISGPISGALLPRLARLAAERDDDGLYRLYRNATQLVAVIAAPAALVLAIFSEQVLWAWTGDAAIARAAHPVLSLYALGNGVLALAAFPYYLQFAKGDLKLHLLGNVLFVLLLVPALVLATMHFGVKGAGWAWLGANSLYFVLWIPIVHRRFTTHLHLKWLFEDVLQIAVPSAAAGLLLAALVTWPQDRLAVGAMIMFISLSMLLVAGLCSSLGRGALRARLQLSPTGQR